MSKYREFVATADIPVNGALTNENVETHDNRARVREIVGKLCRLIRDSGVPLQDKLDLELSHHYGLERFYETGCAIITCVNREYCKKLILLLPGQWNPTHTHHRKEETFHVLYGEVTLILNGVPKHLQVGELAMVERNVPHSFGSETGCVIEEVSTQHYRNDSIYDDPNIAPAEQRKTFMTFYSDWITKGV